jgi:hypothetical protein
MFVLDFIALILAVGAPINAWLHPGGILEELREYVAAWAEGSYEDRPPTWREIFRERIGALANCRFCLSYHVPWVLLLLCYVPSLWLHSPWDMLVKLPIYSLAATRVSMILWPLDPDIPETLEDMEDGTE